MRSFPSAPPLPSRRSAPHRLAWRTPAIAVTALAALAAFFLLLPTPEEPADGAAAAAATLPDGPSFAVRGARVFDGERLLPAGSVVVVRDGEIAAVGPEVAVPEDLPALDAAGRTLLPGLIDSHVHAWGTALEDALRLGVTTELDMFADPGWVAEVKAREARDGDPGAADLYSAGLLVTVAGGHGTEYPVRVPVVGPDTDYDAWVGDRLAEGSDWIKVILEDGSTLGTSLPTLSAAQVAGIVRTAHARGTRVVAHVGTLAEARSAIEAGVDGLAHLVLDAAGDETFAARAAAAGIFAVPTLTVLESVSGVAGAAPLADDPRLAPYLRPEQTASLRRSFPRPAADLDLDRARLTTRRLLAAGVPILAGSDAPNPGTAHGASLHRELELLVSAGLTPAEALSAATAAPAAAFGLADRGRIAPGRRADLVLVEGDPTADVTAARAIVAVWKRGRRLERRPVAQGPAAGAGTAAVPERPAGSVGDFADGLAAPYGSWIPSTDRRMGGASVVELAAEGGALTIRGEIRPGFLYPWAGAMFLPGPSPMAPADLSAAGGVRFRARGTGTYRLMLFSRELGQMPATVSFTPGGGQRSFRFAFSDFGVDGSGLTGLLFTGGPEPGAFALTIDDVAFDPALRPEGGG